MGTERTDTGKWLLLTFFLVAGNAAAAEWVPVGERGPAEAYIEVSSIEKSGKYRVARLMTNLGKPYQIIGAPETSYASTTRLRFFDCAKGRSAITETSFYADSMATGEIVEHYSTDLKSAVFSRHLPGSLLKKILDVVCSVPL